MYIHYYNMTVDTIEAKEATGVYLTYFSLAIRPDRDLNANL